MGEFFEKKNRDKKEIHKMKLSLLFGCSFAAPLFQGNNWDFILPYYLAKKINYQAPTLNLPNINWNPIQTDSKTFLKEDVFPAVLADKFKDTNMEAVNWYYYMKRITQEILLQSKTWFQLYSCKE